MAYSCKPLQGKTKDSLAGATGKDLKGKYQGHQKEEDIAKDKSVPYSNKVAKRGLADGTNNPFLCFLILWKLKRFG